MSFIDDAKNLATMPIPGPGAQDEHQKVLDAMPVEELASTWRALQHVGIKDHTEGTWAAMLYFDHLPHAQPERAYALVLEVLRTEFDKSVVMQLNDKLMLVLVGPHGALLVDRMEAEARSNERLRWLLGGAYWWASDQAVKARLGAIVDEAAWQADDDAHKASTPPIDFPSLSIPELARVWVDQHHKLDKDRDDNWFELSNFERELREEDPEAAIDLVFEILKIEAHPAILSVLAAGHLEDSVSMETIDRVEREAKANPRFRELLAGVWYFRAPDELKARLDAILGRTSAVN